MFNQFFHVIENHTDEDIIAKFTSDSYSVAEAEKVIRILKKNKDGLKVKLGEKDYILEIGSDLNVFFPPPAIKCANPKQDTESVGSLKARLSEQQVIIEELQGSNRNNLNNGDDLITLTMMNGEKVPFMKTTFPADELEEKLNIPEINGRNQEWLNEFNLSDLLDDYKKGIPQIHPGLGHGSLEKGADVLDGSRRLKSRIIFNRAVDEVRRQPYTIYLPVDPNCVLSTADAMFISNVAKKQKQLSSVEKGFKYHELTSGPNAIEQQALAAIEQVDPSTITHLRRVAELPRDWLDALPDIYMVKDTHVKTLYKLFKAVEASEIANITNLFTNQTASHLKTESNIAKLTTTLINSVVNSTLNDTSKTDLSESKPKAITLLERGRTKVTLTEAVNSEGVTVLKMAKLPNELRSILTEKISALIKEHAELI